MYALFITITKRIEKNKLFSIQKISPLKLFFLLQLFVSTYFDHEPYPVFGIRGRMSKQMSSPHKVAGGNLTTIRSEKEGSVTLQYPLLMKSNYATW